MKGKLRIEPKDEMELYVYNLNYGIYPFDYEISIGTDLSKDFLSLVSTTGDLAESIDVLIEITDDLKSVEFYKQCKNHLLKLLNEVEYISFGYNIEEVINYIKNNPILKTRKILFTDVYDLNPKVIKLLEDAFGNETDNIYFDVAGNAAFIDFEEYKQTIDIIDNMIKEVEKFNFSPLEKVMYVYDLVRNKVYLEVEENEDKLISRTLSSVLLGDKIVCVGYAKIFKTLLEKLGIHSREVYLYCSRKVGGHARNEVYIKDEKYGVDGVYYFDPTWDSKRNINDTKYLLSYRFFGMTKKEMDSIDKGRIVDLNFPYFKDNLANEFQKIVEERGMECVPLEMIKSINHMSWLIRDKSLINRLGLIAIFIPDLKNDINKIFKELKRLVKYFNKPLQANLLLEVLYNVRKNQYYSNPQKYTMSLNDFFKIVLNSEWTFNDKLFNASFLSKMTINQKANIKAFQLKRYSDENDLEKNIEQVKFTKVLRLSLEKRINKK